jgi:hypothetical protein
MLSHPIVKYGLKFVAAVLVILAISVVILLIDGALKLGATGPNDVYQPSILGMIGARMIGGSPLIAIVWVWWRSTRTPKPSYEMDES